MEPASILTIVATSISVIVKTSICLKELSQRYRSADQEITLIIIRLNTIEAIVSQIGSWLRSGKGVVVVVEKQMAADIRMAVSACDFVVGEIYNHVERVRQGWFGGRIRHLWTEDQQLQYQRGLDSQISALGVLLNIAVLKSQSRRLELLEALSSSDSVSHAGSAEGSGDSVSLSSTTFPAELVRSRVYQHAQRKEEASSEQTEPSLTSGTRTWDGGSVHGSIDGEPGDRTTPAIHAASENHSSNSPSVSVRSQTKPPSRRLRWRNDDRTKLSQRLQIAVLEGQSSTASELCSSGADANYRHRHDEPAAGTKVGVIRSAMRRAVHRPYGRGEPTLLHHAAEKGNLDMIRTLVSHGADVDAGDKDGNTPLSLAGESAAELLLSLGADGSKKDDKGATPLHYAAARGHTHAVTALLKSGANVNAFDNSQKTPLHQACVGGERKTVSILVEAGAFVDASDAEGLRPLHVAAKHGHDRIVRGLLRAGANPEAVSRRGWRPIHHAAAGTSVRVVENLLAVNVKLEASVADGHTPLQIAVANGQKDIVEPLLKAGANVETADAKSNTPLFLAVGSGRADVVHLLLHHEAQVSVAKEDGSTALLEACLSHAPGKDAAALVQVLLEHGARVDAANRAGQTPLSAACSRPSSALIIVQMLLSCGARVRYEDYVCLWRNCSIPAREKKAVHAELDAVAPEGLKKDQVEWLMTTL